MNIMNLLSQIPQRDYLWEKNRIVNNTDGCYANPGEIARALYILDRVHLIRYMKVCLAEVAHATIENEFYIAFLEGCISDFKKEIKATGRIEYQMIPLNPEPGKRYWVLTDVLKTF